MLLLRHGVSVSGAQLEAMGRGLLRLSQVGEEEKGGKQEKIHSDDEVRRLLLRSLSHCLFESGGRCVGLHQELLDRLVPTARREGPLQVVAWTCLGNVCARGGARCSGLYQASYEALVPELDRRFALFAGAAQGPGKDAIVAAGVLLRALKGIIVEARTLHLPMLASLMSGLRSVVFYDTPWAKGAAGSSGGAAAEADADLARALLKARVEAIGCLCSIAKVTSKQLRQYWPLFSPEKVEGLGEGPAHASLVTLTLHDQAPGVRVAAAAALTQFVETSRTFLAQSGGGGSATASFTSLSHSTVSMLQVLHEGCRLALVSEPTVAAATQVLKLVNMLIAATPYDRLERSVPLAPILALLRTFFFCKLPLLRLAALPALETALSLYPAPASLHRFLTVADAEPTPTPASCLQATVVTSTSTASSSAAAAPGKEAAALPPHIEDDRSKPFFEVVLHRLVVARTTDKGYLDLLRLVGAVAGASFGVFLAAYGDITPVLLVAGLDQQQVVRLQAAKIWEAVATGSARWEEARERAAEGGTSATAVWSDLLGLYLAQEYEDDSPPIRASAVNTYAAIPEDLLETLPAARRALAVTLVLGSVADSAPVVRSAACRALGVFVLMPCLRKDPFFLVDAAEALMGVVEQSSDENLAVRSRASWSLANLCDALRAEAEAEDGVVEACEDASPGLLGKLLEVALRSAVETDKIRCNAVRALGNLAQCAPVKLLLPRLHASSLGDSPLARVVSSLTANFSFSTLKVRWNALHALSLLLRSEAARVPQAEPVLAGLGPALALAIESNSNTKTRMAAASVLCGLSRSLLGASMPRVLAVVASALAQVQNSSDTDDWGGFGQREAFREALDRTVVWLCGLLLDGGLEAEAVRQALRDGRGVFEAALDRAERAAAVVVVQEEEQEEGAHEVVIINKPHPPPPPRGADLDDEDDGHLPSQSSHHSHPPLTATAVSAARAKIERNL